MREGARPPENGGSEAGFALVAVLWFLVLVSAVVASFAVAARTEFLISANARQKLKLDLLADGVMTILSHQLVAGSGSGSASDVRMDSSLLSCSIGRYLVDLRVQDQSGLIDLNAADEELLRVGLRSLGLPAGVDKEVAKGIVAFRSYQPSAHDTGIPVIGDLKGGPFESVVELSDFGPLNGVEPSDLHRVFTVQSRQRLVLVSRSPRSLAEFLQEEGGNLDERQDVDGAKALAIEVSVRDHTTAIRGYAGYLLERSGPAMHLKRVEPLFEPAFAAERNQTANCPSSLRSQVAQLLADAA